MTVVESRAAVITGLESELEVWTIPVPELQPGSLLVRVDAATLCGTDAHRWQGHLLAVQPPFIPGHETCGTIVEKRGDVRDILDRPLAVGDRIISSYGHCGHCYFCRVARQTTLCSHNGKFGCWEPHKLLGGCAEYHVFPADGSFVRIPDEVSSTQAASAACALRTVIHAYEQLGTIESHETVVIQGAGPLGLYAVAVARDRGAERVLVVGAPAARLDVAIAWGADEVLNIDDVTDPKARLAWVHERTGGRGADIVMQCANSPALIEGLEFARRGGRLINVGVSGGANLSIPPALFFRGVRVNSVVMGEARHFYQAIDFLATRRDRFPFERLFSNTFSLNDVTAALRGMATYTEIKPVILPHG